MSGDIQAQPPSTPVRGRTASRYPAALSKGEPGRVPLHRRGTSRTLECMEDLLRENGYKEIRVFTPEAERIEALAEQQRQSTWRIRDMLRGWLGAGGSEPASEDEDTPGPRRSHAPTTPTRATACHSTPGSPLNHKRRLPDDRIPHPLSSPNSASSTTLSSFRSAMTSEGRTVSYQPTRRQIHDRIPAIRAEMSSASLRTYAQVSAARGYLRHMVSTPNMAERTPLSLRESSTDHVSSLAVEHPLPSTWLESVTKAVLKSGNHSAYVGGPISRPTSRQSGRPTRAYKENKFLFGDRVLAGSGASARSASGLPPGAALYMQRSQTAPGTVSTTHVVCRSAPGSRSASRVGERFPPEGSSVRGSRRDCQDKLRRGSKLANGVPSLATTRVENDVWAGTHWVNGRRVPIINFEDSSFEEAVDSDDEDDGELDLARLLVPPKRQYSIQSLRKHLHAAHAHAQARPSRLSSDWEEEEGVPTRHRVQIDEDDGYPTFERTDSKRRRGLPGGWGNSSGGK